MKIAQRQESNSDHAWMVPNKAEVGCQVHKALGPESYLCQWTKTIRWAKAGDCHLYYHPVTQTAFLGSGQLQLPVTIIELSLGKSYLTRIDWPLIFLSMVTLQKSTFAFSVGHLLPFHVSKFFQLSKPASTPLFSRSRPLCWYDSLLCAPSYLWLVPYAFSTSDLCSDIVLYFLCISGDMNSLSIQWVELRTNSRSPSSSTFPSVPFHGLLLPGNLFSHLAVSLFFSGLLSSHPYHWAKQAEMVRGFCYQVLLANRVNITIWKNDKNLLESSKWI